MPIDLQTLQDTQQYFGFETRDTVEKDWYVVQAIRAIQEIDAAPFELVFAGGTCLARAHRVVERMSEDVDFKVVAGPGTLRWRRKFEHGLKWIGCSDGRG